MKPVDRHPSRRPRVWFAAALLTSVAAWVGASSAQAALGPAQPVTSATIKDGNIAVSASADGRTAYIWDEGYLKVRVQAADGTFGPIHNLSTSVLALEPVMAAAPNGRFFVMWQQQGGYTHEFFARVINPNGTMTKAVRVVPDVHTFQSGPAIAITPQGTARMTVAAGYGPKAYRGVLTRTLSKTGKLGPVVRLAKRSGVEATQVAIAPSGAGIVTWQLSQYVRARRFSPMGKFGKVLNLGFRSILSASPPPALAISPKGVATVAWVHAATKAVDSVVKVQARRVTVKGTLDPLLTLANADIRFQDLHVAVGTDGGSTVAWTRFTHVHGTSAQVRRINLHDALGTTRTLSQPADEAFALGVVRASSGNVFVLWQARTGDYSTYVQRVSPNGSLGTAVALTTPAASANYLAITTNPQGRASVLWSDVDQHLFARRGTF